MNNIIIIMILVQSPNSLLFQNPYVTIVECYTLTPLEYSHNLVLAKE